MAEAAFELSLNQLLHQIYNYYYNLLSVSSLSDDIQAPSPWKHVKHLQRVFSFIRCPYRRVRVSFDTRCFTNRTLALI